MSFNTEVRLGYIRHRDRSCRGIINSDVIYDGWDNLPEQVCILKAKGRKREAKYIRTCSKKYYGLQFDMCLVLYY